MLNRIIKIITVSSLLMNVFHIGFSQESVDTISMPIISTAEISWIDQFPSKEKKRYKNEHGIGKFFSLVAGGENNKPAELMKPITLFATSPKDVWIVDQGSSSLFRIKDKKAGIPKVFSRQKIIYQSLVGICALPGKGILFTDSRLNKIFLIKSSEKLIISLSDSLLLQQPTGIAYHPLRREIWVVETALHCITILDESGKKIRSFGSRGSGNGQFNFPTSVWIDNKGTAYVIDALNYRVQIFNEKGEFIRNFGEAGSASGYFASPKGIATDSYGNIYIADALFHVVQIFDNRGRFLLSFGSQGREEGQFWMPTGVFIDEQDNIYVADSYNSRIQIFKLSGIIKRN